MQIVRIIVYSWNIIKKSKQTAQVGVQKYYISVYRRDI